MACGRNCPSGSWAAGQLDQALNAFQSSLGLSEHLNLFASWAVGRCALVLIALGEVDRAVPLVARALIEGPPLGHYEARLAEVELSVALSDLRTADLPAKHCDSPTRAACGSAAVASPNSLRQHRATAGR